MAKLTDLTVGASFGSWFQGNLLPGSWSQFSWARLDPVSALFDNIHTYSTRQKSSDDKTMVGYTHITITGDKIFQYCACPAGQVTYNFKNIRELYVI